MLPNPQFPANLVTFTKEMLNRKTSQKFAEINFNIYEDSNIGNFS